MCISVSSYEDAALFSAAAREFLFRDPVLHNIILTLLDARVTHHEPGRYWVAARDGQVAGLVFQSPLTRPALLAPMDIGVITALVGALADTRVFIPGVIGDVLTAASFAGQWSERCKSAAIPSRGLRLYALAELHAVASVDGKLRKAEWIDRDLAVGWMRAFLAEIREPVSESESLVDACLRSGRLWLWHDGQAVTMAVSSKPIQGVVRVSHVYTPPHNRRRGYAAACVYEMSKLSTEAGCRCILYADLGNPTSNSIYRRIGYRAVAEMIDYRFDYF